ncbi:hypothetical protein [Guillardia theta]|uniref:Uncharacterized protein n=1 Tax=Guillardia theta TaxID=55529 RepID=Q9AW72_GUITH|nr:hypothetical protein GTHECHR2141 [Guillardia theta]CAC26998.1 hypothetical protein [Guillardia theta]
MNLTKLFKINCLFIIYILKSHSNIHDEIITTYLSCKTYISFYLKFIKYRYSYHTRLFKLFISYFFKYSNHLNNLNSISYYSKFYKYIDKEFSVKEFGYNIIGNIENMFSKSNKTKLKISLINSNLVKLKKFYNDKFYSNFKKNIKSNYNKFVLGFQILFLCIFLKYSNKY